MELTTYRSTATVQAMKIATISINPDYSATLTDDAGVLFVVTSEYVLREKPLSGGYYMKNNDGFEGFIKADVFELAFSLT
ncbi:hypothetical protein ACLBPY_04615 [Klebsiella pneumoniae]|uniref:hypothetical protein n=1 Tax=Klebsiella pneumoniae TaxID=573 RepID=UPI003969DA16